MIMHTVAHFAHGKIVCINERVYIDPACGSGNFLTETYLSLRRLSDYIYSINIVYNNFPWCTPTAEQKAKIEQTAQGVLDACE